MSLRHFTRLVLGCLIVGLTGHAKPTPPNIIVMLADDQGWGDLGIHGHPSIHTPHLDQLAREGASVERFYVQPVCSPTRAEFLTGRHHLRGGVTGVSRGNERLAVRESTIADAFRAAGYATGCFGKWHNGSQGPFHPNARGFDEFYGFTSGHWGNYFDAMMDHNGRVVTGVGYLTDDITTRTLDFMAQSHAVEQPFFAYLAFNVPHSPMQVPDAYWESWRDRNVPAEHRYADQEDRDHSRAALAMVENLDNNVGRVLLALEQLGIAEDTIVVYFSDNGPNGLRWNGELKGRKGSTDEGGVRSPLMIRWPRHIEAQTRISTRVAAIDLFPTLASMAGVKVSSTLPLDGLDLAALLTDGVVPEDANNRLLYHHWSGRFSVRGAHWMLDHSGELFDLTNDPTQLHPVTSQHPEIAADLAQQLAAWRAEINRTAAQSKPAIMVGYPGTPFTTLPARDATLHGALERSNRFPNDSYIRNWTTPSDRLTWEIEVARPGRFAVEVYYTCPEADTGAQVSLAVGNATLSVPVQPGWDPPELGAERDRIPRQESYVKDFRPLHMGEITLPAGPAELVLQCPRIPGDMALDFRLLTLERLD